MTKNQTYDVIIIGGGYAGLTAAAWLGRYRRAVLVISDGPTRNQRTGALHGYPGFDGAEPADLLDRITLEAESYGANLLRTRATAVTKLKDMFTVSTSSSDTPIRARRLLVATGTKDTMPDIPGFDAIRGISAWHCPACDGYEYSDRKIAVFGWGDHIAEYALQFRAYSSEIIVYTHGHADQVGSEARRQLHEQDIPVIDTPVSALVPKDTSHSQLQSVSLEDGTLVPADALFYSIGQSPRVDLPRSLGCEVGDGFVVTDRTHATTIPGVFAAGDITDIPDLIVVACASGATAAASIHSSLS